MNRSDLERLINLGVSLDREEAAQHPEFQALKASLLAEEEECERSKPENIRAEITQCLEHACCRYLPAWFDQRRLRVRCVPELNGAATWHATVDSFEFYAVPRTNDDFTDDTSAVATRITVPETRHGMCIDEPHQWLDERYQPQLRAMCARVGKTLGERMTAVREPHLFPADHKAIRWLRPASGR